MKNKILSLLLFLFAAVNMHAAGKRLRVYTLHN